MFSLSSVMKLISLLSVAALVGLGVSVLDFTFVAPPLGLYAVTACILFLLGVVRDYAPRRPYWQPRPSPLVRFPAQAERLAA